MLASRPLWRRSHSLSWSYRVHQPSIRRFSNDRFAPRASFELQNGIRLHVAQGDLTLFAGDAIVNAANEQMLGGSGVDGAIHKRAGPKLVEWIEDNVQPVTGQPNIRCVTGTAVITPAFDVQTQHIIHTVGPIYANHDHPETLLYSCYSDCLRIAMEQNLRSIAFPAISCGVFGYPQHQAIEIAFESFQEIEDKQTLDDVWFIVFGNQMFKIALEVSEDMTLEPLESLD